MEDLIKRIDQLEERLQELLRRLEKAEVLEPTSHRMPGAYLVPREVTFTCRISGTQHYLFWVDTIEPANEEHTKHIRPGDFPIWTYDEECALYFDEKEIKNVMGFGLELRKIMKDKIGLSMMIEPKYDTSQTHKHVNGTEEKTT